MGQDQLCRLFRLPRDRSSNCAHVADVHLLIYRHNLCDSLEASQMPIKIDCDLTYFALYRTCCQKHEVHFGKPALMLIKVEPRLISVCVWNCWLPHPRHPALVRLFLLPGFKCTSVARILYNASSYIALALGKRCTAHMWCWGKTEQIFHTLPRRFCE